MTAITSAADGNWSLTATWTGGVLPASGDTVTINHNVVFNVDQSGFAVGLAGLAISTGKTLKFITDGTICYLKMAADITGAGQLWVGNSKADAIPLATSTTVPEVATIEFNGDFKIALTGSAPMFGDGGTNRKPFCAIASKTDNTHIVLSSPQTNWLRQGDTIAISDSATIGIHSPGTETYTVSAYNDSTKEVTLGSSLVRAVNANSVIDYVVLISHSILINNSTASAGSIAITGNVAAVYGVHFKNWQRGLYNFHAIGGTVDYCSVTDLSSSAQGALLNGSAAGRDGVATFCAVVNGTSSTCFSSMMNGLVTDSVMLNCQGPAFGLGGTGLATGYLLRCVLLNGSTGLCSLANLVLWAKDCIIYNFTTGLSNIIQGKIINCIFQHCTTDISKAYVQFFNCLFGDSTEFAAETSGNSQWNQIESFDHDQSAGAYKACMRGGTIASVTATPSPYDASRPRSYQMTLLDPLMYCWMIRKVTVPTGGTVYARVYVQKSGSQAYLPRVWIYDESQEPMITGIAPNAEMIMTNSTTTWEILEAQATNTSDHEMTFIVACIAKGSSGTVTFDPIIRVSSFLPHLEAA